MGGRRLLKPRQEKRVAREGNRMGFEDLDARKRSARLSATLYRDLKELKGRGFRDQLTRSGVSVPSNIAEGLERNSHKEIAQFLKNEKDCSNNNCPDPSAATRWRASG